GSLYPLFSHCCVSLSDLSSFFCNHPAPTYIYTLSLHDALPIYPAWCSLPIAASVKYWYLSRMSMGVSMKRISSFRSSAVKIARRSEEHTSELQSRFDLVCRLLLEKKKKNRTRNTTTVHASPHRT